MSFEPDWRWSTDVKPSAETEWRQKPPIGSSPSRLGILMAYRSEFVAKASDATHGHDAWVRGDEPVVVIDWFVATNYAR